MGDIRRRGSGVTDKTIRTALAQAVVQRDVPDDVVDSLSASLAKLKVSEGIRRLDVCTYGICVDYFVGPDRWREMITDLLNERRVRRIETFPWGILDPDLIQIKVEYQVNEINRIPR